MKYDDQKFPIYYLQKGLDKLVMYGMDTFLLYCDEIVMPFCDRNRLIAKCNQAFKTNHKQLRCPDELKDQRWHTYTKIYGYSNKKAKEFIEKLDSPRFYDINYDNDDIPF